MTEKKSTNRMQSVLSNELKTTQNIGQSKHKTTFIKKNFTLHDLCHVYRAKLVLFQGAEGELQLRALIFIQVFPALSNLVQKRQALRLQQHSSWDGHLTVEGRGVSRRNRRIYLVPGVLFYHCY